MRRLRLPAGEASNFAGGKSLTAFAYLAVHRSKVAPKAAANGLQA
jgi:hypothetical protein